jgi:2-methylisocitrate lyase-like PEP mutase family enzyme
VVAPGAYDSLSARLVEEAGFPAVYMTGFGVTASPIGRPDVGLLTMTEMVDTARRIASTVDLPVLADADTGYGNTLNVVRTVREYETAGVAGTTWRTRSHRNAAGTSPASGWCRWKRWWTRCGRPSQRGGIPTSC